jgi:hypothetical protein
MVFRDQTNDGTIRLTGGAVAGGGGGEPGPPGPPGADGADGAAGPTGLTVVHHGASTSDARPSTELVYWVGTATPANAEDWDFHLRENI